LRRGHYFAPTLWRFGGDLEDTAFDELRELCAESGDNLSLSAGLAGVLTVELFHNRYADASLVASDCLKVLESIDNPGLTLTLWGAAANAKVQAGEAAEALRLVQHVIDWTDDGLTTDDFLVSSPLAFGYGLRGISRLSLGMPGWRTDLDHALRLGRSADPTTLLATTLYKYVIPMHNGATLPNATGIAETAEMFEIAERSGDSFALDCAYLARGTMLINTGGPDRALGFELLDAYRDSSLRKKYTENTVRMVDTESASEKLRLGDVDGAIELARPTVDFLFTTGEMTTRGLAVTVLVESLLRRGAKADIADATDAIDRLAAVPTDAGYVLLDLPLLRMRLAGLVSRR
jgi:adenylate cyclase